MSDSAKLLVPIRIDALVVGRKQPSDKLFQWTNLVPDWFMLRKEYWLGSHPQLYKTFKEAPKKFMPPGIHLHFRLPRALTHGIQRGQGFIEFPVIPNRWLVQRTWRDSNKNRKHKAWLIKSDAEAKTPWSGDNPGVTWPEFPVGQPAVFKSIGQCTPLTGALEEVDEPAALTLTAIGPADPTFAAYYPACRSVLGFHDNLDDLRAGTELSYFVTGWYSKVADDLLNAFPSFVADFRHREKIPAGDLNPNQRKKLLSELKAELNWACEALEQSGPPLRLMCYGLVRNVGLTKGKTELHPEVSPCNEQVFPRDTDEHKRKGNYQVAVGEAPGEALAALFKEGEVDQDLFTALQAGLLSQDTTVSDLRYQLHARRFGGVRSGTVFHVQPESEAFPTPKDQPPQRADTGVLPEPLRSALRELNRAQSAFDRQARRVDDCTWLHYACWYLWTNQSKKSGPGSPEALRRKAQLDSFADLLASEKALLKTAESARNKLSTDIKTTLEKPEYQRKPTGGFIYRLTESALRPFEGPNDPIIAIDGPAMQRLGTWIESDEEIGGTAGKKYILSCRLSSAVAKDTTWQKIFGPGAASPGGIHSDLLLESLSSHSDRPGEPPSSWSGNPWIPLFLVWEVGWQSDYSKDDVIASEFVNDRWTLARDADADGGPDLALRTDAAVPSPADWVTYQGRSILTPSAANSLAKALKKLKPDDSLIPALENRRVMSQALDGLHEALMRRQAGTRLPALEFDSKKVLENPVSFGAMPSDGPFFPIRAGRLKITRLHVVDAFGQTVKLPVADVINHGDLRRAHNTVIPGLKKDEIALRPRFATPMCLRFELENAGPVCGWVLPNHMEQSLAIYSASGKPLGAFQKRFKPQASDKAFYWVPFPGEKDGQPGDDALAAWVRDGGADELAVRQALRVFWKWVSGLNADQGGAFSTLLDESIQATDQRVPEEDPGISVLVGRPLALVRASLRLESPGLPAHSPELVPNFPELLKKPAQPKAVEEAIVTRRFEQVRWPVRVGDRRARNDGIVGVFKCSSSGTPEAPFYSTWGGDEVKQRKDDNWERCSLNGWKDKFGIQDFSLDCEAPLSLMMLMDPQARAHAAIGALPRVYLELPADISSGTKRVRDVFFQTAPVLGESDTPHMPRPSDDYGQWSWAWRPDVTTWKEDPALIEATDRAGFSGTWPAIAEGWLKLRIAPVKVVSFWVREAKDPLPEVPPYNIHLAWSLQSAEAIKLERSEDDGKTFVPVKDWTEAPLPREHEVTIERPVTYRLTATADADVEPSWKEVKIEVKGPKKP